jgi:hypothetical protein
VCASSRPRNTERVAVLELHALCGACVPAVVCAQLAVGEKTPACSCAGGSRAGGHSECPA